MHTLPPLAGLASYHDAARVGLSVEDNVSRLVRYAWVEKRAMEIGLYWLASTPEWEAKEALGLHLRLDAEHAARIRARVAEMRNPPPRLDISPDAALDRFFDELLTARDTVEKIAGLYGVLKPALLAAYEKHRDAINPIIDHPTWHMLRHLILDESDTVAWGQSALDAITPDAEAWAHAESWCGHLRAFLAAAGGVDGATSAPETLPEPRATTPFVPDFFPQRDERFALRWNFVNPQRQVSMNEDVPLDERTLALMCRRIVEMDVPEYMTRIIAESGAEEWDYYVDMTRQLWDEVRHAMMGTIYFAARGVDWKQHIAIHPGMAIRLGTLNIEDAHSVLYAIEQNLMPAKTGKRLEFEISQNAGDPLAAYIQDYDWADEVLHVYIGRRWLLPRIESNGPDAVKRGLEARAATVSVLDEFENRGEQFNWWPEFARLVLGRETAHTNYDLTRR